MRIGLYTLFAVLFIIAVAVGTYLINPATYSFELFDIHMPKIPVAVWVALPVALLAVFSILHMMFYGTKSFFATRRWKSDAKKLEDSIYWALIKEPQPVNYSNEEIKSAAAILSESYLEPLELESGDISFRIKETAKVIKKIENGEYVDLKTQKFAKHLTENNPIMIKNHFNHLEADPKFALKVIDFRDKYSKELVEKALDKAAQSEDFFTLKKYAGLLGKERFFKLLNRAKEEDIGLSVDMLKSFIKDCKLECRDYYKMALVTLDKFTPDENLELYKSFSKENEEALAAYLFLLFRYEMLDKISDILEEHADDEYKAFRALLALKKGKANYTTGDILTEDNICK